MSRYRTNRSYSRRNGEKTYLVSNCRSGTVSDCGNYLILTVIKDCRDNLVFFANLQKAGEIRGKLPITPIVTKFEADYDVRYRLCCFDQSNRNWIEIILRNYFQYITNNGSKVIFRTNKNAPNYRLISVDLENPAEEHWTTLLAEDEKDVLDWAHCVDKNKLIVGYLHDVKVFLLRSIYPVLILKIQISMFSFDRVPCKCMTSIPANCCENSHWKLVKLLHSAAIRNTPKYSTSLCRSWFQVKEKGNRESKLNSELIEIRFYP